MNSETIAPESLVLSMADVGQILEAEYGLRPSAMEHFPSELSSVYRVTLSSGDSVAFKASLYSAAAVQLARWRAEAMEHLEAVRVPSGHTIATVSGDLIAVCPSPKGKVIVQVSEWLRGVPLESANLRGVLLRDVGRTAAAVSVALAGWPRPPAQVAHPWEMLRTLDSLDSSIRSAAREDRSLLVRARQIFEQSAAPHFSSLPFSVVHHDLHDSNLLVDESISRVCGVLDFGDMVWGPRVAELVVAAGYGCRNASDRGAAYLEIAAGWGSLRKLTAVEARVLLPASIGRLAVNLGVWSARSEGDRADYARARSRASAAALGELIELDRADFENKLADLLVGGE
ncbi:phosphotransferase [Gulosibacter massiliensis]|uniref:phosphotransferase n=1 Tax=Gulosibacter massiliensis TaxID=2479839 RepID=UPI000F63DB80|nr:phosphotransferase [Gulosibacter massiliensis]